ncbi:hypothetical protein PHYC_02787 [Phycisphaerales bacterium]|nr:hypothetical protein PHYC_02787 [Phycisphaerales bacterium]
MSAVDSLSNTPSTAGFSASQSGFSAMTSDDFAKIIFTELTKQDPLSPSDTNALIQQISGIRSIQSNLDLTSKLESLVSQNEFAGAATLIGKQATGLSAEGSRVSGLVKSVSNSREGAVLSLEGGGTLLFSALEKVEPAPAEDSGGEP